MKYILDKKYDTLERIGKWDKETQKVIEKRIANELGDDLSCKFLTGREAWSNSEESFSE